MSPNNTDDADQRKLIEEINRHRQTYQAPSNVRTNLPYSRDCSWFGFFQTMATLNHFKGTQPIFSEDESDKWQLTVSARDNMLVQLREKLSPASASDPAHKTAFARSRSLNHHLKSCAACSHAKIYPSILRHELKKCLDDMSHYSHMKDTTRRNAHYKRSRRTFGPPKCKLGEDPASWADAARKEVSVRLEKAETWERGLEVLTDIWDTREKCRAIIDKGTGPGYDKASKAIEQIGALHSWLTEPWNAEDIPVLENLMVGSSPLAPSSFNIGQPSETEDYERENEDYEEENEDYKEEDEDYEYDDEDYEYDDEQIDKWWP